jgi:hypothetical protein
VQGGVSVLGRLPGYDEDVVSKSTAGWS